MYRGARQLLFSLFYVRIYMKKNSPPKAKVERKVLIFSRQLLTTLLKNMSASFGMWIKIRDTLRPHRRACEPYSLQ